MGQSSCCSTSTASPADLGSSSAQNVHTNSDDTNSFSVTYDRRKVDALKRTHSGVSLHSRHSEDPEHTGTIVSQLKHHTATHTTTSHVHIALPPAQESFHPLGMSNYEARRHDLVVNNAGSNSGSHPIL